MYQLLIALICMTSLAGTGCIAAEAQRPATREVSPLLDAREVHTLHLTVSAENWAAIQPANAQGPMRPGGPGGGFGPPGSNLPQKPGNAGSFTYVRANLEFQGSTCKDIGLRFKGNSSFRSSIGALKQPFKLDFDRFVKGQEFMGLSSLHLNINAMDPSAMREHLAYMLFQQAGIPCSRTAYARVYLTVPGAYDRQYLGLYLLIEDVNKAFAKSRFGSSKGLLVKPDRAGNLPYLGDEWQAYRRSYEEKAEGSPALQRRFIEFLQLVHAADDETFRAQVGSYLDVDEFLQFIAINALLSNMDSFLCTGHNFCLYLHPETRKIVWIPWDLNEAFAGFFPAGAVDEQIHLSIDHPYTGANRLLERILAIPEHKRAYRECVAHLMATTFKRETLQAALAATQRLIADAQAEEQTAGANRPRGGGGPMNPLFGGMRERKPPLDVFIAGRIASVSDQLAGRSTGQVLCGQGPRGPQPMSNPLMQALDVDRDGELSAEEMAAAPAVLKKVIPQRRPPGRPNRDAAQDERPRQ